jgi:hypothetical protein
MSDQDTVIDDLPPGTVVAIPADGRPLFRKLIGRDPAKNDFKGDQARGRPFVPEDEAWIEHTGLSLYDDAMLAARIGVKYPAYVAEVRLPEGAGCSFAKTAGPGHHTIWGRPDDLFDGVVALYRLEAPSLALERVA